VSQSSRSGQRRSGAAGTLRTADRIRQEFLDFFRGKEHAIVPSAPVVPHEDPTLLFTNAGMNQFKDVFLGTGNRSYRRAADTQKCIRAGGKHNDLDDVGHDTYHHTFFEMLGNWSFGDYFKKEAIEWAWELLTEWWGVDPRRLHATYFQGDPDEGLDPDDEARELWLKILPPEHVHPGNKKDNFWEMGDTGPCGPCSEIHIDLTEDGRGGPLVNAGDARVIEIWNLVFIQFNRGGDGKLTPLPARHVDTGMGLERVAAVIQGHNNNYATEVFVPIIQAIEKISRHTYGGSDVTPVASAQRSNRYARFSEGDMRDEACRVIADHVRCLTFALTDGAVPDREGRGYVLRRILRRAVRYGWQYLDLHKPFLCELVDTVVGAMGGTFPELKRDPQRVREIIREEEESFERTLDRGIALFEEAAAHARARHHNEIRGSDAFKLHDTYGFPIDLTQVMAQEKGLTVDVGEYERLMEEARERARGGLADLDLLSQVLHIPKEHFTTETDDEPKYTSSEIEARYLFATGLQDEAGRDCFVSQGLMGFVFDRTCFYAEQGGQVGDRGTVIFEGVPELQVVDTKRVGKLVVHLVDAMPLSGTAGINPGQTARLRVDTNRRATMKNHTATHVMNWALREVLGEHVQQKGSLVDPEKTRFDFSHPKALTPEQIARVEQLVQERIRADWPVDIQLVPQQEALKINGLRAVFGERYPDEVRVMSIGVPVKDLLARPDNPEWRKYSIEFCGGTHLRNTGAIERFAITTEEAVAKGIRRIVAVTGETAKKVEEAGAALLQRAEQLKSGPPAEVPAGLAELQQELAAATLPVRTRVRLEKLIADLQQIAKQQHKVEAADAAGVVNARVDELLAAAEKVAATTIVVGEMPDVPVAQLKGGADRIKQKCGSAAVLFGAKSGDKALLLAAMSDDLVKRGVKAGDLVREIAGMVGGGGGGPPTMAQAGGKDASKLPEALAAGREWIRRKLG